MFSTNTKTSLCRVIFEFWEILWYPSIKKGVWYLLVGNLLHQVTFLSYLTVPFSHYAILTSHVTVLFSHLVILLLFLTFDDFIPTLCNSNNTCDNSFLKFGGSFTFFFSPLMISSLYYAVPTSYVIVLFSHLTVPLLFSHIWWFHPHIVQLQHHMWQFFSHIWWFPFFFSH